VVYFGVLGALGGAQAAVFVHLEEVYIGGVDEEPWVLGCERLCGEDNGGWNGVVVCCTICLFLRGADKLVMEF
jgi:hypothetical protein